MAVFVAVILLFFIFILSKNILSNETTSTVPNLEKFVYCLNNKGIFIYGSGDDPNVKMQLSIFGNSSEKINLVDCSSNFSSCQGIIIYPTWNINDILIRGGLSLNILSKLSGCSLI